MGCTETQSYSTEAEANSEIANLKSTFNGYLSNINSKISLIGFFQGPIQTLMTLSYVKIENFDTSNCPTNDKYINDLIDMNNNIDLFSSNALTFASSEILSMMGTLNNEHIGLTGNENWQSSTNTYKNCYQSNLEELKTKTSTLLNTMNTNYKTPIQATISVLDTATPNNNPTLEINTCLPR